MTIGISYQLIQITNSLIHTYMIQANLYKEKIPIAIFRSYSSLEEKFFKIFYFTRIINQETVLDLKQLKQIVPCIRSMLTRIYIWVFPK